MTQTKILEEITAISRMIEHVGDHLTDLGIIDAELNRLLSSLQFKLLTHTIALKLSHSLEAPSMSSERTKNAIA